MKVDATIRGVSLAEVPAWARACEAAGFDAVWTTETNHDPFFPLVLAAEHTERLELATGVALAFPRSPVTLAHLAWDLQTFSRGRFILGLGSQVKAHVVRRFGAQWSHPARRMHELVRAVRAVWDAWEGGGPLDFRGEFYSHTLMPPAFSPGPSEFGRPPIHLAAVQERMTEVAGEVADGIALHPIQTERYLREVTLPALERGLERAGRAREAVEVDLALFAVVGGADAEGIRRRIAFYGSTPAYRGIFDLHGWGSGADELHRLSRTGGWNEMAAQITDEMLDEIAVVAPTPEETAARALARYGGLAQRINLHAGEHSDLERWAPLVRALRTAGA